ncbi:hypothetical protein [Tsukamurella tyrosinosolvens]|uniref:hypothetical protein n=1 Tax=Tsukamurella tyrosinosolvens TaxID=57704 RepID=UPI00125EE6CB|nr:hypothetical protein [Tsukamurella tyrosinosolvens]
MDAMRLLFSKWVKEAAGMVVAIIFGHWGSQTLIVAAAEQGDGDGDGDVREPGTQILVQRRIEAP